MKNGILEVSQNKKVKGRTYIKWIVHEIYDNTDKYNSNGISWSEQYVQNNIDTIKSMPICVEFLDFEKSEPFGHGMSEIKDGNPLFEYSQVVGVTENGYIDTVEMNGEQKKVLIAEGYIYSQRYPSFVQWLKSEMFDNKMPDTSVEICAKEGYETIIYRDGWKEQGRVPMIYDYTGSAILGITPADPASVVLELNNKLNKNKEEKDMEKQDKVILELNQKLEDKTTKINSLTVELNSLKEELEAKDSEIAELNSTIETQKEEMQVSIDEVTTELNSAKEAISQKDAEIETLTTELNELRQFKEEAINKELVAELNEALINFTDEEKSVVKDKIEAFATTPSKDGIADIVSEINAEIAKKVIEARKEQKKVAAEQNSKGNDIYGDILEANSSKEDSIDELY